MHTKTVIYKFMEREFTSIGPNLEIYEDGEFATIIIDMNTALHTIGYIRINVYHDASGTIFVKDSNGNNISNRLVKSISYTYPYTTLITYEFINGVCMLTFDDDSTVTLTNTETNDMVNNDFDYWYLINDIIPNDIKPFT